MHKPTVSRILLLPFAAALSISFLTGCSSFPIEEWVFSVAELHVSSSEFSSFGSAFLIDAGNGYLFTNAHAVLGEGYGADINSLDIELRFPDEEGRREVDLLYYDVELDIALLQASSMGERKAFEFCNSKPTYGQNCYAVGNSHGYGISIIEGIVSIPSIYVVVDGKEQEYIQANIDIYPGSSGGVLLSEDGKVLGMTSLRLLESDGDPVYGFGYSIPSSRLQLTLDNYIESLA